MASFYISAAHKSSGKTTLSIGLSAAIQQRALSLQTFKKGPDYIDPIWLTKASGTPCYNLDFFTSSPDYILQQYSKFSKDKSVVLVEGNMGLYDGLSLDGSDSNAAMAKLLNLPVILVVDCSGTSRGIAPLLNGYQQFDSELKFAGVIFNKVAGNRHETKMREVVEAYTDFKILGAVQRDTDIQLTERHLGLIPSNELADKADSVIELLTDQVNQYIDIDALLAIESIPVEPEEIVTVTSELEVKPTLRIAVASDEAFGFYYPGDLQRFQDLGVEIVTFNTLDDFHLPEDIDGLFIGGGFPETQLEKISANTSMISSIRDSIEHGLPSYAECGGLMYLCTDVQQNEKSYPLCNVIPASVTMNKRPQGRGYVILQSNQSHPWYEEGTSPENYTIRAHEFHYSALQGLPDDLPYAYSMKRGTGIDGLNDGIIINNLLASYTHLRQTDQCSWVDNFVSFVKRVKRSIK